ncbi:MAG: GNAT family N-acyltransferase [Brachymonas sp.]|nr:GNAT family N-acyltransferase [Brachymonas sp.]
MKELPIPTFDLSPRKIRLIPLLLRQRLRRPGFAANANVPLPLVPSMPEPIAKPIQTKAPADSEGTRLDVRWARHLDEIRDAQRLRYEVFSEEMGATLSGPVPGHDIDRFDDFCEHLLVRDADTGLAVGTYRVLTPVQAQRAGSLYSDAEFDLTPLDHLRPHLVEVGRSCVHADYRSGAVIMALWGALAAFMRDNQLDTMIGCASIPMRHNGLPAGHAAASIWEQVRTQYLADPQYHVTPRLPLPVDALRNDAEVEPPALIKGYLRLGTKVLGAPAWDPEFNSADLPMMLRVADLPARYRKRFMEG